MPKGSQIRSRLEATPRVRRGYFECRYGQLHVYNAIPPGGGFEERTPLLCLHAAALSGRTFERFLAAAGRDRSVFAPDLPGFGSSDAPAARPTVADHAAAIGDFLDSMRLRQLDVLGCGWGGLVGLELALTRPTQIRRLALMSLPEPGEAAREDSAAGLAAVPSPVQRAWARALATYGEGAAPEVLTAAVADDLRSGPHAAWARAAELEYPLRARLARLSLPVLVLRPGEESRESAARVREALPRARLLEFPEHGAALLETAPLAAAEALASFFD